LKITEGYYFKLHDNTIFYAKGVIHPPNKVVGYPKYIPSPKGDRVNSSRIRYYKEPSLLDELKIIQEKYSKYLVNDPYIGDIVPEIPYYDIKFIYDPVKKANKLIDMNPKSNVLRDVRDMILDLRESINVKNIGVSGSILVDLYRDDSDIDIVVYGENEGLKVYNYLLEVIDKESSPYRRYDEKTIERVYRFRSKETPMKIREYVMHAKRRVLEGFFKGREYFIRLIKRPSPHEDYGKVIYRKLGKATLKLKVINAREAIYTPCRYFVEVIEYIDGIKVNVDEIYSIRGRFNELALEDEIIIAHGTIEKLEYVNGNVRYRLYLGHPGDYLMNLSICRD